MASRAARSAAKEQYWREVIDGWRRSGGSVRQWCSQRQISEPSFYSWRRTLSERDASVERKQPVRRKSRCQRAPTAMIPVEIVSPSSAPQLAPLEITLGGGIHLKAFLMELDPPYCDVIVERYEIFTGKKAERIAGALASQPVRHVAALAKVAPTG